MTEQCPHGHGDMTPPVNGDPLEPDAPWCLECGHIYGRDCDDGCDYDRGALEETFNCATCKKWIKDIVDLIDHAATPDCDHILPADALSSNERSTLLYIESRIVDNRAVLDTEQMNYEDRNNIKLFAAAGLLGVEEDMTGSGPPTMDVMKFTDEAWDLAAACRKMRGEGNVPEVDDG